MKESTETPTLSCATLKNKCEGNGVTVDPLPQPLTCPGVPPSFTVRAGLCAGAMCGPGPSVTGQAQVHQVDGWGGDEVESQLQSTAPNPAARTSGRLAQANAA